MTTGMTIECSVHFQQRQRGRKELRQRAAPSRPDLPAGRVPRVPKLLALALGSKPCCGPGW
jgi:hypothetical protein